MTARGRRFALGIGIAVAVLVVLLGNAHLVYVALDSQPDCVPHTRAGEGEGAFGAARSSC
jgi:hypothetical protein